MMSDGADVAVDSDERDGENSATDGGDST